MTQDQNTRRGIGLYLLAVLIFSVQDGIAKHLAEFYDPFMVVWARYSAQTAWTLGVFGPFMWRYLRTRNLPLQLIRSAFLFGATLCFFNAFKHLPLAESVAIFEIAPLIITGLSVLVLGEKVGWRRILAVSTGLLGALIIIRPGSEVFSWAALYPVGAALCFACYSIATRFLSGGEPALTSFVYTALIGTIAASVMVPFVWETPAMEHVPMMVGLGLVGGAGHYLLIAALALAPASVVAPFSYIGLLFAVGIGVVVFGEVPDLMTAFGALVIVGAGLYVWYRENAKRAA